MLFFAQIQSTRPLKKHLRKIRFNKKKVKAI